MAAVGLLSCLGNRITKSGACPRATKKRRCGKIVLQKFKSDELTLAWAPFVSVSYPPLRQHQRQTKYPGGINISSPIIHERQCSYVVIMLERPDILRVVVFSHLFVQLPATKGPLL